MAKSITVNGLSLQDTKHVTQDILYRDIPTKNFTSYQKSRNSGFILQGSYFEEKKISIEGNLFCDSEADLKTTLDEMKEYMSEDEFDVDIDDGGTTKRFCCSLENFEVPEKHYNISNVPYSISLKCQPFGKYTTVSSNSNIITNASANPFLCSFDPIGNIGPKPIIKFQVISSVPASAISKIVFYNLNTVDSITVDNLLLDAVGDYLEIDCEKMTVKVSYDGGTLVNIDYTGIFPKFSSRQNNLSTTLTGGGASFSLQQTIIYYPTFI